MRYRLVIFDFDGTLADSFGWFVDNINGLADRFDFDPFDLARLDDYRGLGVRELMARLRMPLWKMPAVTVAMRRAMADGIERIRLFDGALPTLHALRSHGVVTALVTSNSRANVQRVLGDEGGALIDHFGCGAAVLGKRPLLQRVIREAGVDREHVLCIGDELRDADAARAVGVDFVGVGWGFATPEVLAPRSVRAPFAAFDEIVGAALATGR